MKASVLAIEQRDPTTAGHSGRVATLTVGLARPSRRRRRPTWRGARFDAAAIQQLRYAALLHDFGKVGVREHVLVKADKLYPQELELLRARFDVVRACLENERLQHAARRARADGRASPAQARELDALWEIVVAANRPPCSPRRPRRRSRRSRRPTFVDPRGEQRPLLTPGELSLPLHPEGLALRRGAARRSRATSRHTFSFLSADPLDPRAQARAGDRLRPPREARRAGLPPPRPGAARSRSRRG